MENLAPTGEQLAFVETAQRAGAACSGLDPGAAAAKLAESGLLGILADPGVGGLGLGMTDAVLVAEALGAHLLNFPYAEGLAAATILQRALPVVAGAVVSGQSLVTVAWNGRLTARYTGAGWRLSGNLAQAPLADKAQWLLAAVETSGHSSRPAIAAIDLSLPGWSVKPDAALDHEMPTATIRIADLEIPNGQFLDSAGNWDRLSSTTSLLRAAEMLGGAETSFAAAREHVITRRQFGRALVANQAIRHMLAHDYLALQGMRRGLAYAATKLDGDADDQVEARLIACAAIAEQAPHVIENAMQLHGAMGFTWDLGLHRYLRRARAGATLFPAAESRRLLADLLLG